MDHNPNDSEALVRFNKANTWSNIVVTLCGLINLLNMLVFIM